MYKLEDYKKIARQMISADAERDRKFEKVDEAHNVRYELPQQWRGLGWLRAYPTTKPADLIDAATRALSTKSPQLSVTPLLPTDVMRELYNRIERGLMWHWKQIERRAQSNPTKSIVESAIKYSEVTAQLVYLPYQDKILKGMGSKAQKKRANRYGPFSVVVHNPRNVHVQYSDLMPERVLLCKRQAYHEVIDFWGKNADGLRKSIDADESSALTELCYVYDMWDSEYRCVWVEPLQGGTEWTLLEPQEHNLGFLPWSCRVGGTSLDELPEDKRRPLLNNILNGNIIQTTNHFRSLMLSLVMARASEPNKVSTSPTGDGVDVDATKPLSTYDLRSGETLTAIPAGEIGQSIVNMYQMLGGEMTEGTGMSLLLQNAAPSGMAFATYNATIQAGMGAVNPLKQISENAIADIFGLMVAYLKDDKATLLSYDDREKNLNDTGAPTLGAQEIVMPDELPEPEDFYASVKLVEYIPTDDMGKVNSATMMKNQLNYPVARALASLDVADPEMVFEEYKREQLDYAAVQMEIAQMQFDQQLMQQKQMAKMQAELQQEQMAAQQAAMQPQGQPGGPPPGAPGSNFPSQPVDPMMEQGFAGLDGQNFNGAMGGSNPLAAAPEMTGQGLPAMEGRDYRGLRMPPEGREPVE